MGSSSSSSSSVIKWHSFHRPMSPVLLLKLFLLLWAFYLSQSGVVFADLDKSVLLQWKTSVSDPSGLLSNWDSGSSDHCSWFGVFCDSNSRVVSLNVTGNGREGNSCSNFAKFPLYGFGIRRNCLNSRGKLVGKLLPVIAKVSGLRILSLPFNGFDGEIPGEIWGMEKLEVLDLEGNPVTGSVPVQFVGLRNLRVLNLGFNRIVGEIPSSLSNCVSLEILNLAGNDLNGMVPMFVGGLRGVYFPFNLLTGQVPSEIGENCEKLEHLDLFDNVLVGGIPRSLGEL
jgi:Leucine-rich repeat (LRR) protein